MLIFILRPFLQRSSPGPPKMSKITPQSASRWPDKLHLKPSWRHLGAKFGHLAAILGIPRLSKIGQHRPRQPPRRFSCQGRFQNLPDPLQISIFIVFGTILGHMFANFLKTFSNDSVSNLKASHKMSLGISLEAGGGGTRPQGVFAIYIYIYMYRLYPPLCPQAY